MEFFSAKLSVLIAAGLGALYRIYIVRSNSTSISGKVMDYVFIAIASFIISLLFIGPVMAFFSISASYAAVMAFILALSADYVVRKILVIVNELDLLQIFKDKFGGKK